ncbi:rRNA methylase [Plasmodium cynomolgi strain B]|uniref:rRNA methylase n=1 Tax=Plasmodium cynomolgi (strain B) TaxID=1120755 RepID=K6UFF7_PLACD|nr:rRNA methylase [Plasmodium cynomolgi strain B]GAB70021.1 rRNA methylase [Plasmodium cynomolgi strain B]
MKIDTPVLHSSVGTSEFLDFFHVNNMVRTIYGRTTTYYTLLPFPCSGENKKYAPPGRSLSEKWTHTQGRKGKLFNSSLGLTFMDDLKSCGFKILSTCCRPNDSSVNHRLEELANVRLSKNEKFFIILGNETKGLSKEILDRSDICIYINGHRTEQEPPTPDLTPNGNFTLDSLNVNNACAIVLHHFTSHLS